MTIRVVLSCNGRVGVYPCRQAIPVGEVKTAAEARTVARTFGWTSRLVAQDVLDDCPACTRRRC